MEIEFVSEKKTAYKIEFPPPLEKFIIIVYVSYRSAKLTPIRIESETVQIITIGNRGKALHLVRKRGSGNIGTTVVPKP